jgi:cysteine synthase
VDVFVSAVGTGGTITGLGEALKQRRPAMHVVAVEPAGAAVLSGGQAGSHRIPGIGVGFVPPVLNVAVIDEVIAVSDGDAFAGMDSSPARQATQEVRRRSAAVTS